MKIKKIEVQNYKAVAEKEINLNGCSAIIAAGNDKGKTSILRGLIDRLHSEKPDIIVKRGEEKGYNNIELTDGSRIEWNFTDKSERLSFITPDGIKQTSGVIGAIGEKYFGKQFDIDEFLNSGPKKQQKILEGISGADLEEIEQRYNEAYEERTEKNRELKNAEAKLPDEAPEKVERVDVSDLIEQRDKIQEFNRAQEKIAQKKAKYETTLEGLEGECEELESDISDLEEQLRQKKERLQAKRERIQNGREKIDELPEVQDKKETEELDEQIKNAQQINEKADKYQQYLDKKNALEEAREAAEQADKKVKEIEQEKQQAIAEADFPEGFDIGEDGLTYNGFPLTEKQVSTSAKYIAALKLGAMVLGEVKTLHFDAAPLDRESLDEVKAWADQRGLQLLIERPDYDGGEITYELIENHSTKSEKS